MIGEKIKELRVKNNMTQKNLADKLFVTAQAVSRWEKDEVEPSLSTVASLAKIFGVSVDEIIGIEKSTDKEAENAEEKSEKDPVRHPIAGCSRCHCDIYDKSDMIKIRSGIYRGIKCKKCANELADELVREHDMQILAERHDKLTFARGTTTAFFIGAIVAGGTLWALSKEWQIGLFFFGICYTIVSWIFTYFLRNTFIGRALNTIFNFWEIMLGGKEKYKGAIRFFFISAPSFVTKFITFPLSVLIYLIGSIFIFPYALVKSYINKYEYYLFEEFWDKNFKYGEDTVKTIKENVEWSLNYPDFV